MSADGSSIFFGSQADDLVAGRVARAGMSKVFRWNRAAGENELVVHDAGSPAKPCAGSVQLADISADGRWVLLWRTCSLVAGDANGTNDVYFLVTLNDLFADRFESGDATAWSQTIP